MAIGSEAIRTPFSLSLQPLLRRRPLLFAVVLFFLSCFFRLASSLPSAGAGDGGDSAVGYGYRIRSVDVDPTGKSLTADLDLIRKSSVYGPDVQRLSLQARLISFSFTSFNFCFILLFRYFTLFYLRFLINVFS